MNDDVELEVIVVVERRTRASIPSVVSVRVGRLLCCARVYDANVADEIIKIKKRRENKCEKRIFFPPVVNKIYAMNDCVPNVVVYRVRE